MDASTAKTRSEMTILESLKTNKFVYKENLEKRENLTVRII